MEAYTTFAGVYDMFMDNIPYEKWVEYLHDIMEEYNIHEGTILELGCGTGNMTELLASKGYDMIGVDNSEDMLELAMEKRLKAVMTSCIFCRICSLLNYLVRLRRL